MSPVHQHVNRLLRAAPGSKPRYHWHHVLGILDDLGQRRTPQSEAALRRIARFRGKLRLDPRHGLPHAMSPEDLLRFLAVQQLARWDRRRHRAVIGHVSRTVDSDLVRQMTRLLAR